jgi:hypothetical protein
MPLRVSNANPPLSILCQRGEGGILEMERYMSPKRQPSLPAKRAFVVQVHADAKVEQGQWQGRVEHLVSYQAARFQSLEELLTFMVKVLSEPEPEE